MSHPVAESLSILRLLAHLNPALEDAIHPHGPYVAVRALENHGDGRVETQLSRQPLLSVDEFARAVSRGAAAIADATIAAHLAGRDAREITAEVGDELCPRPPAIRWPKRWPPPVPPGEPYPIDRRIARQVIQAQAALVFQSYADGIGDEDLGAALAGLADRLATAALEPAAR
jgi:hypothetical protein